MAIRKQWVPCRIVHLFVTATGNCFPSTLYSAPGASRKEPASLRTKRQRTNSVPDDSSAAEASQIPLFLFRSKMQSTKRVPITPEPGTPSTADRKAPCAPLHRITMLLNTRSQELRAKSPTSPFDSIRPFVKWHYLSRLSKLIPPMPLEVQQKSLTMIPTES